jgi:CheY-like chemotaxis protein
MLWVRSNIFIQPKENFMKHIIIADDDPAIRDIFKLILERSGYAVTMFANGESLMKNEFVLPNLFLLDKQLSGNDGLDVCRFLKSQERTKNIPVIITSASPYVGGLAEEAGANAFIEKPFKTKELISLIEQVLNKNYFTAMEQS